MGKLVSLLVIAGVAWYALDRYELYSGVLIAPQPKSASVEGPGDLRSSDVAAKRNAFRCDGRTHCSQMTSCEEAEYFLANCPGIEMDGDRDGVPCERQWCDRW